MVLGMIYLSQIVVVWEKNIVPISGNRRPFFFPSLHQQKRAKHRVKNAISQPQKPNGFCIGATW